MKKLIFLLVITVLIFSMTGCEAGSGVDGSDEPIIDIPGKWTVMVWLDGDNNLESSAVIDINEMEEGLYKATQANSNVGSDVSVIVQIDRISGYLEGGFDGGGDWTDTRRYKILPDSNTTDYNIRSERLDTAPNLGEVNMGDANNLKDFITYCKTNYPSDNYALILWNHGGGVRGTERSNTIDSSNIPKAICWDDTNSDDCLYIGEITDVLTDSEDVGFLGLDACLMGMAEVAYEYRPGAGKFDADFMSASPATEQGDGWEYQNLFSCFTAEAEDGITDPSQFFSRAVVAEYIRAFSHIRGETMSAYDLSKISDVKSELDDLSELIITKKTNIEGIRGEYPNTNSMEYFNEYSLYEWVNYPHFDLYDFAEKISSNNSFSLASRSAADTLKTAISSCIIKSWGGSSYSGHSNGYHGLGFFLPEGDNVISDGTDTGPEYSFQWWYTLMDTNAWSAGKYYGKLDFCNSNNDGTVEGWRELLEYWYDDDGNNYTPGSY